MQPPDGNRYHAGKPTPCPDCGVTAVPTDISTVLPGQPRIHHEPTCPTYLAALELLGDDLDWFCDHPGTRFRLRPVARCEFDELAVALGRRVPRSQRRHWVASVVPFRTGVSRAYACDGRIVSIQLIFPDQVGVL